MSGRKQTTLRRQATPGLQTEFYGDRQVVFEDAGGVEILEYNTETVRVKGVRLRVRLFGTGLDLGKISPKSVMIRGQITSMEFE